MKLFPLVFALLFSMGLSAQSNRLSFHLGGAYRGAVGNPAVDSYNNPTRGIQLGLNYSREVYKGIAAYSGIYFQRKGVSNLFDRQDSLGRHDGAVVIVNNLDYLTMPLGVEYRLGNKFGLTLKGGGYFSYLLSEGVSVRSLGLTSSPVMAELLGVPEWDFGLEAGLGTFVRVSESLTLDLELRGNWGLYNLASNSNTSSFNFGFFNRQYAVLFGLSWRF